MKHTTVRINAEVGAPFVRNFEVLEHLEPGPDSFVDLQYEELNSSDDIRISARNRHPSKSILAHFYTVRASCDHSIPSGMTGGTIKACLKPSQTTIVHFDEKRNNPQLFLFNARFEECESHSGN